MPKTLVSDLISQMRRPSGLGSQMPKHISLRFQIVKLSQLAISTTLGSCCAALISWCAPADSCGAQLVSYIIAGSCGAWLVSERQSTLILQSINCIVKIGSRRRRLWRRTLVCRAPARRCGKTINAIRNRRRETGAFARMEQSETQFGVPESVIRYADKRLSG